MNTDLVSFDKFRARILEHGIRELTMSGDETSITYTLMNGEVYEIYTTELFVPVNDDNDDEVGEEITQSELRIYQKVEP
jgi:hypothetical protein